MRRLSEGKKMFVSVMALFVVYGVVFIVFEDYDRRVLEPLADEMDWHLLWFSLAVVVVLACLLLRYSRRMDARISREQAEQQTRLRRQLTQNIAHELKTPVASIMGYMETLADNPDMDAATSRQFIARSLSQAQRLTALLQDISTLNRMDYAPDALSMEPVDVSQLVADIGSEVRLAMERWHMSFDNQLPAGIIVTGNPSLVYSIFRNLTDNAISYAGEGCTVTLSAIELGHSWQFSFFDNGVGVAPEHLPRIFERFYRVDKGRSRQSGGTGLGLAIVKNAILLHGGNVTARTNASGGLCLDFTLKK